MDTLAFTPNYFHCFKANVGNMAVSRKRPHRQKVYTSGPGVSLTLCCFVVYSTRRFVLCLTLYYFILVFFSPFNIAITALWEERINLSAFRTFVRFVLVWFCRFPLSLGVWEGLRFVIVAFPGLFSYHFYMCHFVSCIMYFTKFPLGRGQGVHSRPKV